MFDFTGKTALLLGGAGYLGTLSDEASYVTGHILNVDGGWSAW